jgi:hypothetical protein
LEPSTGPFIYIKFQGKMVLYPKKEAAEQLRVNRQISITDMRQTIIDDILMVTVSGRDGEGRTDVATGAVSLVYPSLVTEWVNGQKQTKTHPLAGQRITGEDLANAAMKAETKAKRRLTFSLCGWSPQIRRLFAGNVDIDDDAASVSMLVDSATGEIIDQPKIKAPKQPVNKDLQIIGIMCKQLFGDKADEARAWLAGKISGGTTTSTRELTVEQQKAAREYLEADATRKGWERNPDTGHWEKPGEVLDAPEAPAMTDTLRFINTLGRRLYGSEWPTVSSGMVLGVTGTAGKVDGLNNEQAGRLLGELERQDAEMVAGLSAEQATAELFGSEAPF